MQFTVRILIADLPPTLRYININGIFFSLSAGVDRFHTRSRRRRHPNRRQALRRRCRQDRNRQGQTRHLR